MFLGICICLILISLCCIIYSDITERLIPNAIVVFLFLISFLYIFVLRYEFSFYDARNNFSSMISILFIFFSFYLMGVMGAGDVKLASVLAFLLGLNGFLFVFIFSIIISFIYFGWICFFKKTTIKFGFNKKIAPYGAFMSFGVIAYLYVVILCKSWGGYD